MFPGIKAVKVDNRRMASFKSEVDYLRLAVDLLREATSYVCVAACIMGEKETWNRDQAIVGGHGVRIYKLLSSFIENTIDHKREISDIIMRITFESIVNVVYICHYYSEDLINSYLEFSFRHERKLKDLIESNIAARSGEVLPIEDRMLKSIANTERNAGIEISELNLKDKSPWGKRHLHQRAIEINMEGEYEACFSGMSHNVHGSWQDIFAHHIVTRGEDRFAPALEWTRPRPQSCLALVRLACDAAIHVAVFLGGKEAEGHFLPNMDDLLERNHRVGLAHEKYLSGKAWPET